MNDLTPEAAAMIRAGRTAFRPNAADRDRVLASLGSALGETALSDGARQAGHAKAAAATRLVFRTWVVGGVAAVALATGVVAAPHRWTRSPLHTVPAPAPPAAAAVEALPPAGPSPADVESAREQAPPVSRGPSSLRAGARGATRTSSDSLPEEVRLLFAAERQMSDGRAADALKTLAEHERRFPTGALAEDRMAARVQVLCSLGRTSEAESELAKLTRAYPGSPHLEHARAVCGIDLGARP